MDFFVVLLCILFILFSTFGPRKMPIGDPTERDRIVAATVVQWLGSNVGMGFLQAALDNGGSWSAPIAYSTFVLFEIINSYRAWVDVIRGRQEA